MIGSGTPKIQSNAPLPKPISASIILCEHHIAAFNVQVGTWFRGVD
jgi:hypothetical protein